MPSLFHSTSTLIINILIMKIICGQRSVSKQYLQKLMCPRPMRQFNIRSLVSLLPITSPITEEGPDYKVVVSKEEFDSNMISLI